MTTATPVVTADLWAGPGASQGKSLTASRARNALIRHGYGTVAALTAATARDLTDLREFGDGCLKETRRVLAAHGLRLAGEGL